jgi:uncharacterized UPF0146 family protein
MLITGLGIGIDLDLTKLLLEEGFSLLLIDLNLTPQESHFIEATNFQFFSLDISKA